MACHRNLPLNNKAVYPHEDGENNLLFVQHSLRKQHTMNVQTYVLEEFMNTL